MAVRPVELDLLSGAALARFAEVYHGLAAERPGLRWVHLGDSADLGCASESEDYVCEDDVHDFNKGEVCVFIERGVYIVRVTLRCRAV